MRRLFVFVLFACGLFLGLYLQNLNRSREIFQAICQLSELHFYRYDNSFSNWLTLCKTQAARTPTRIATATLIHNVQTLMDSLNVSHFSIYTPSEDKKVWTGQAVDTGIRAQFIEEHLLVYHIIPGSVAEAGDVRAGDEITEIENAEQVTPWGAQNRSGRFVFLRGVQRLVKSLKAGPLQTDFAPQVVELNAKTALLALSSFRSEYFAPEPWRKTVASLRSYHHLIVDLRENSGGNFVAMLRGLSPFFCEDKVKIGELRQPRRDEPDLEALTDDLDDTHEIDEVSSHRNVGLVTYGNYGCYRGSVTVLIGPNTMSVSEIFAHSFYQRRLAKVVGLPSGGDVVLAIWYELPMLGAGYSISIPEANYVTSDGIELEGRGVIPQREIYNDLALARQGKDTAIEYVLRNQ